MEERLTRAEMADLVEGYVPRLVDFGQDLSDNLGGALAGVTASKWGTGTTMAIGSLLQLGNALAGPRHPYMQMFTRIGVGMNTGAIAIKSFQFAELKKAAGED